MVSLISLFTLILLSSSCAKMEYLYHQGMGQIRLLNSAKDNDEVLRDVTVLPKFKEKIRKINKYKSFFYKYWNRPESQIYSKTTFLENDAVTYLVITSPHDKIITNKECFPIMGCFPYLGFFDKEKAFHYARLQEEEGNISWVRPVYAYSTLGYFEDTILSSFFHFSDYDLAELIFHELFHTIFFIKDEVDLNENLANFFGKEMALIYFKVSDSDLKKRLNKKDKMARLSSDIVQWINKLNLLYKNSKIENKEDSKFIIDNFLEKEFLPHFEKKCRELELKKCFPVTRKWNNASFAAFMTYEKKGEKIRELQKNLGLNLVDFFIYIENKYKEYKNGDFRVSFFDILFRPLEDRK